jgi:hypothetical protein
MSLNGPEEILTNVVSISAEAWLITGSSHAATAASAVSTYAKAARAVFSCRLSLSTLTMSGKPSKLGTKLVGFYILRREFILNPVLQVLQTYWRRPHYQR